jgi:ribosomal protein S12 methylthiotransferase accessory factor YcaO
LNISQEISPLESSLKDLDVFTPPTFDDEEVAEHANLETHFIDSSGLQQFGDRTLQRHAEVRVGAERGEAGAVCRVKQHDADMALERTVTELLQGRSLKDLDVFTPPTFDDEEVAEHSSSVVPEKLQSTNG